MSVILPATTELLDAGGPVNFSWMIFWNASILLAFLLASLFSVHPHPYDYHNPTHNQYYPKIYFDKQNNPVTVVEFAGQTPPVNY